MIIKNKFFKSVCATFLAAMTIGFIVPKTAGNYPHFKNDTAQAAEAQTSDPIMLNIRPIHPNNGGTFDFTAKPGEKFKLAVNIYDVPDAGINCSEFAVKFDSNVVTIDSVEKGDALPELTDDNFYIARNKINFLFAFVDSSISSEGTLLEINGTVKPDASKGDKAEFQVVPIWNDSIIMAYLDENGELTEYNAEKDSVITVLEVSKDIVATAPVTTAPPMTTTDKPITNVPTTTVKSTGVSIVTIVTSEPPVTGAAPVTSAAANPVTSVPIHTLPYWPTEPDYTVPIGSGNNGRIVGDLNNSKSIDAADLVMLKKYIVNKGGLLIIPVVQSGSHLGGVQSCADTNGDGYIDVFDVIALRKYLLK